MILDFLNDILKTDVNNLFEDISVIKNLNNYEKVSKRKLEEVGSNMISVKIGKDEKVFDLNKEKITDVNKFLNMIFKTGTDELFKLSLNKYKIVNDNLYFDFISNKNNSIINIKIKLNSFFCQSIDSNNIGNLESIKIVKTYSNIYMYLFFENTYFKISIFDMKIFFE